MSVLKDLTAMEVDTALGVRVAALKREEVVAGIIDSARSHRRVLLSNHNVHSSYLAIAGPSARVFAEVGNVASLTFADGLPVSFAAWLASPRPWNRRPWYRVGALDWLPAVLQELSTEGGRLYYLGGTAANLGRATQRLQARYPDLVIEGHHGYLDGVDVAALLADIRAFGPDLLLVGMGMPLQEQFILRHWDQLPDTTIMNVGALFDYLGGDQRPPPRWLGPLGLEWLYRLVRDPRRLWRRYLLEPILLVGLLLKRRLSRVARR